MREGTGEMGEHSEWLKQYAAIPLIALFAGITRYLGKLRGGQQFGWLDFFAEMTACVLSGVIGGLICNGMGLPEAWQWAVAAMCGHMGGRGIGLWQEWLRNKAKG